MELEGLDLGADDGDDDEDGLLGVFEWGRECEGSGVQGKGEEKHRVGGGYWEVEGLGRDVDEDGLLGKLRGEGGDGEKGKRGRFWSWRALSLGRTTGRRNEAEGVEKLVVVGTVEDTLRPTPSTS